MLDEADQNRTADTTPNAGARQRKVWQTPKIILANVALTKGGPPSDASDGTHSVTS